MAGRTAAGAPAAGAIAAIGLSTGPAKCAVYDVRLAERHRIVQVRAGLPSALAIALREGKAVDARVLANPSGTQTARFENREVDQVLVYCSVLATSFEVCLEDERKPEEVEASWADAEFVVKNLQLPLRTVDQTLGSAQEEQDLAKSRLFSDEEFDKESFEALADLMNAVAVDAKESAPVWYSTVTREELEDPFIEVRSWSYALALLVDPAYRRMLGFAVLDPKSKITPGDEYDYRVTGRFYRRDVEERVHGFHAVPRATTLPRRFALGDIALRTPFPAIVHQLPFFAADSLEASGRKGIAIEGDPALTITFPSPVRSVVLELEPGDGLRYRATTTDYFPGLPIHGFNGQIPPEHRVTLEFADPVHAIRLEGDGFLYAIREVLSAPGTKPDDVVTRSVVVNDVKFVDAGLPKEPLELGTVNLQQPILPTPGATAPPPASLGFGLHWTPPPPTGASGPVPWPADAGAAPPFDALGFSIERKRVDTNGDYEPIDGKDARTLAFGSRGSAPAPPPLCSGADLEEAFPEDAPRDLARAGVHVAGRRAREGGTDAPAARQPAPVPDLLARRARPPLGERARRVGRPAREAPAAAAAAGPPARPRRGHPRRRAGARPAEARPRPPARRSHAARPEHERRRARMGLDAVRARPRPAREGVPRLLAAARPRRRQWLGDGAADARRHPVRDADDARPAARAGRDGGPLPEAARLPVQGRVAHGGPDDRPARRAQRARAAAHARAGGLRVPADARRLRAAPAGVGRAHRGRPDHRPGGLSATSSATA